MADSFAYDVFLSHNSKDKPRVRKLAERLKAAGVRVWFDEWAIKAGDIIALKVDEGLEQSRVLFLCISPAALASGWVALERSTAIHRDPANAGRRFIPLLLDDCVLPDTLRRYKYVDFLGESAAAFAELLSACRYETEAESVPQLEDQTNLLTKKAKSIQLPKKISPLAGLERKLDGHTNWITSVAVSPNGKLAASGSDDSTVKIWNLETGECQQTIYGHTGSAISVVFSSDGKEVLSTAADSGICAWDPDTGKHLYEFARHKGRIFGMALSLDGLSLFSASAKTVNKWDFRSRAHTASFSGHSSEVRCLAASPDATEIISGSADKTLKLWAIRSGECLATLKGHSGIVHSVQITPNGRFAISGSEDKTIKVWDLVARSCVGTLEGHKERVLSVAISPDGSVVASTGFTDLTVRLWDWKSGLCLQVIQNNTPPTSVAFSPDGSRLIVGNAVYGTYESLYVYCLTGERFALSGEFTRRYVNAKVVLIGEGTVGKTSLAHRLIDDEYVIKDRTHGMNVWRLDLPASQDATLEREALLWDLAGQEDYRLIHRLFLSEAALALLLINPQKDNPFVEAGDWLKALETAASDREGKQEVARLLIFSQIDVGGMKLGNAKIDRFREQHGFSNWLQTSAKTGENCSDRGNKGRPSKLKQLIAENIPWDKLPWTSTPRLLAELKNAVMAMRDESDIRLLRFSELAQRLEQALPGEKFAEPDVRTAVTLLANHGLARPLRFGDLVLLRPDLINGYAGAVIRAARAHSDEIGCVLESDIYRPDFDFTGVERLKHRPDEELLLRALVQTFLDHSLCIAEETPQGRHLVFPSQYRREKDLPRDPNIFVSYSFSGEWQTVWTTLVVRLWYSQEFEHRELWRNAAEFESKKRDTLGALIKKTGDGGATISLYFDKGVPDELRVNFIAYVHRHLARYACEVTRDRRYVCPNCGEPVKDLDAVRRRMRLGKDFVTCLDCDEKVPFVDFIEHCLRSDPVARKILAMDETATRELDTQALEQILIGHMMAITGEANQFFRPVTMFDHGIDGEVEFKDNDGKASGKRIYIQLKSGNSYLRTRKGDGSEVFDVSNDRHLEYWISQPVDVYLVIRQTDEVSGQHVIRWMNATRYLKNRTNKKSRQIIFAGEKLDMEAVWKVRDEFFPPTRVRK